MSDNTSIFKEIQEIIRQNDVVLFMKGTKLAPMCGFSGFVATALKRLQVDFYDVNVLQSLEMRQGIKDFTNWPTIPQLYIKGEFIGGADIVRDMLQSGEFVALLQEKEILFKENLFQKIVK